MLSLDKIDLSFDDEALDAIADSTLKLKTGARGLHTEIERVLMPHMYKTRYYRKNNVTTLNITKELVINPTSLLCQEEKLS